MFAERKREERGMGRIIHDDTVFSLFLGVVVVGGGVLGGCGGGEILNGLEKGGPHSFLNFEQGFTDAALFIGAVSVFLVKQRAGRDFEPILEFVPN